MSATLSKKQQKAAAFRAKQKAKKRGIEEPEDVPEADLDENNDEDATIAEKSSATKGADDKEKGKKRKREDDEEAGDEEEGEGKDKKGNKKGKGKDKDGEEEKKSKKDIKQRFILFIGAFVDACCADL